MDSQKRMLLAMALCFLIVTPYMIMSAKLPPKTASVNAVLADGGSAPSTGSSSSAVVTPDGVNPSAGNGSTSGSSDVKKAAAGSERPPRRDIEVNRSLVQYTFSSDGAGLTRAVLLGEKMRVQESVSVVEGWARLFGKKASPPAQMNLAVPALGEPLPFSLALTGSSAFPATASYAVEGTPESRQLVFSAEENGWRVKKTFRWEPEGFELAMLVDVENTSKEARQGELAIYDVRAVDPHLGEMPSYLPGFLGSILGIAKDASAPTCLVNDKDQKRTSTTDAPNDYPGKVSFAGVEQQYFLSAVYPLDGSAPGAHCTLTGADALRKATLFVPYSLAPGQKLSQRFGVYAGPKDAERLVLAPAGALRALGQADALAAVSADKQPHLEKSADYGFWAVICQVLLFILKFFHRFVPNWGLCIILLTVSVKVVLLPLTHRMMVSQEAMKSLQPKLDEIKKKFPDDRERVQLETMKLYQQEKVNPAGSCLLLLVQMPVWIALFTTLRNSYDIYGEPFVGSLWTDLTYKDPTYLIPVLLGISQVITTRLQPQVGMDPSQARLMNWFMPVFFTVFLLSYPLGLTLYIFTNNVLTVAQTYGLKRYLASRGGGAKATGARLATKGGK